MTDRNGFPDSGPTPLPDRASETYERRSLDIVVVKLKSLHSDVTEMRDVLKELTVAINRLALVEERQAQTALALERAFATMTKLEERLGRLELSNVNTARTSATVDKIIWVVITAVVVAVLAIIGLKK